VIDHLLRQIRERLLSSPDSATYNPSLFLAKESHGLSRTETTLATVNTKGTCVPLNWEAPLWSDWMPYSERFVPAVQNSLGRCNGVSLPKSATNMLKSEAVQKVLDSASVTTVDHQGMRTFYPSLTSDGWSPSVSSSATASPEPYTSNGSTPSSVEGPASASVSRNPCCKAAPAQDVPGGALVAPRKKPMPTVSLGRPGAPAGAAGDLHSSTSTPDHATPRGRSAGQTASESSKSSKGEDEAPLTVCTNCQTTNTPLWRRDPAGQPLCEYPSCFSWCTRCCDADDVVRTREQVTRAVCSTCVFLPRLGLDLS
jgi:hypothetical protein